MDIFDDLFEELEDKELETGTELAIKRDVNELVESLKKVVITSDAQYAFVEAWRKRNKSTQKIVEDFYEDERKTAKAVYDAVLAKKNLMIKPLEAADEIAKRKMKDYATAKELERRAEQKRLEDKEREEAEKKRLEEVAKAVDEDNFEKAAELAEAPAEVVKVEIAKKEFKTREKWTAEIVDMIDFFNGLIEAKIPYEAITVNEGVLNRLAQEYKGKIMIPGVVQKVEYIPVL
jgi:hypothetical protein